VDQNINPGYPVFGSGESPAPQARSLEPKKGSFIYYLAVKRSSLRSSLSRVHNRLFTMMYQRVLLLLLSALGLATAKPFASPPATRKAVLDLRGGAGPIDTRMAAGVLTGIYVLQGSTGWMASESHLKEYYNVENVTPTQIIIFETFSANCNC
jgi:hypothetical protein